MYDEEKSIRAATLLRIAAQNGFGLEEDVRREREVESSTPTPRPMERIVCRPDVEDFSTFEDSRRTLCALHVIVGFVVLACVLEAIYMVPRW